MDKKSQQQLKEGATTRAGVEGGRRPTGTPARVDRETEVSPNSSNTSKRAPRTALHKLSVLATIEKLKKDNPRGIGEYLRAEGLYSKTIERWQMDKDQGLLSKHRMGTVAQVQETMSAENAKLKRQLAATEKKLKQAELLIELQKKISQLTVTDMPLTNSESSVED